MPAAKHYLAFDLGAESGRIILGTLEDNRILLDEIHRFPTGHSVIGGTWRWDMVRIADELRAGCKKAANLGLPISSVSADSWGVDYVYVSPGEPMLTLPYHYRDTRNVGMLKKATELVSEAEIFSETGIQFMEINTLFQLLGDVLNRRPVVDLASKFLLIGDYINYLFSGVEVAEESLASTTQLFNPVTRTWSALLQQKLGLPVRVFPPIVASGTVLGPLTAELGDSPVWKDTKVVATCSHDTGAAIAATPVEGSTEDWAYLSSGTWSLLGIESATPIINEKSQAYNFTNEQGFGHTTRFLKNIVGLWIVQQCRRAWLDAGKEFSYEELAQQAEAATPLQSIIHPDSPRFQRSGNMPEAIADYCRQTGQAVPEDEGAIIRCALESLALLYGKTIANMQAATGREIRRLHILGGGTRNILLNQLAADATGVEVLAGPVEATAVGNLLIQAIALGHLSSLDELRAVVRNSFLVQRFTPRTNTADAWAAARTKFESLPLLD
ncbi:MAG: rhamnulokinase family protein [Candidatus Methylacidiphilales bacterium]|nr:rhamnulokinase family protein [Candidatus Methylacidiphilales bacterium]